MTALYCIWAMFFHLPACTLPMLKSAGMFFLCVVGGFYDAI